DDPSEPTKWQVPAGSPIATTIAAGGHLLIWADGEVEEGPLHASFKLGADGESIGLFDAQEVLLDSITFGPQTADVSYGRYPDAGADWQAFEKPTPGGANASPGDIVISEIMYHPYHLPLEPENLGGEWIELSNTGAVPVDLSGWRFTEGVDFVFPEVVLAGGDRLVVAADVGAFSSLHPGVKNVVGGWAGRLRNSGETIELRDASDEVVDAIRYADEGEWAVRELGPEDYNHRGWVWRDDHDGGGKSLELVNPELPNEHGQNWTASDPNGGTPGAPNSTHADDTAPLIVDGSHAPVVPGPADAVAVTARLIDESPGALTVTLWYRADWSAYMGRDVYPAHDPDGYDTLMMFDDGTHGDGAPDDGVYGAEIPPHEDGTVVEFFIEARDAVGRSRTWPAPSLVDGNAEQVTNALYRVDAAFDPGTYWTIGGEPLYYIILTEMERGRLAYLGTQSYDGYSRSQMNGTVVYVDGADVTLRYNVGVRNRGKGSRARPPNNYRINFRHDRPCKGVAAVNINSKYTYLQVLGNALFRMAGLPAVDAARVQVRVNGENLALDDPTRMYGSYARLEVYDGDWASRHLPNDGEGNVYRCVSRGWHSDLRYLGDDPNAYAEEDYYAKNSNAALNDWSDLINLTYVLNEGPDETYVQDVQEVVNVDQWLRWIAFQTLLTNKETNLSNGRGDDYCMYRPMEDPRFILLPYDLDNILNWPDPTTSIWLDGNLNGLPAVRRLITHPKFVPRYYAQLKELCETVYAPATFGPLVEYLLGGWVPQQRIEAITDFAEARRAYVLSVIPTGITATSDLPVLDEYSATLAPFVSGAEVSGTADAIRTRSVLVNGQPAQWSARGGAWSLGQTTVDLQPGVNRLMVEAFDGPDGTGRRIEQTHIDILYDDGDVTEIRGTILGDVTLDAASGPWHATAGIVVGDGVTLTLEPGVSLFLEADTGIAVQPGGRLVAEGRPYQRIRLTRPPGSVAHWDGVLFDGTLEENVLGYVDMEFGDVQGESVDVQHARVTIDNVTWYGTDTRVLNLDHPSVTVRDSVFPSVGSTEPVHGVGLTGNEYLVFERCVFGSAVGYNDIIDFAGGQRPGPILQIYDCVFLGGGDDGPDLDGTDAHIEGCLFMGFHDGEGSSGTCNAIATGSGGGSAAEVYAVRNVFYDNDQAVLVKENSFVYAVNNTFVSTKTAVVSFGEPQRNPPRAPGRGAYLAGNIFWDKVATFGYFFQDPYPDYGPQELAVDRSILPASWHLLGAGNFDADPLFAGPADFALKAMSPARGAGFWGLDMGAFVAAGAAVSGEPPEVTWRTDAVLTVGGPGITDYRYSLNDPNGPWSEERPVEVPVELSGLQNGRAYTLYVRGKNSAGRWQETPTASRTWVVDVTHQRLMISEVLAVNETAFEHEGTFPDVIELYYDGPTSLNLSGMTLSDDAEEPGKYVFPAGTVMRPQEFLLVYADVNGVTSGLHAGFGLDGKGDEVYLFDGDGIVLDSIVFGAQLADLSVGRTGREDRWHLTVPTFGQANVAVPVGDPEQVRINEWLADGEVLFESDFIELYNRHFSPVDIGGFYLTDNATGDPGRHRICPLTFVPGNGFLVFRADGRDDAGHVNFALSLSGELIGLSAPDLRRIDAVIYGPQTPDVSRGRSPDGSDAYEYYVLPTPGLANPELAEMRVTTISIVGEDAAKRAIVPLSADSVGDRWNAEVDFDDSGWLGLSGAPGGVGYERSSGYEDLIGLDVEEQMYGRSASCYMRVPFSLDGATAESLSELHLGVRYDDGFVAYLNGVEVGRANVTGTPEWDSYAESGHEAGGGDFDVMLDLSDRMDVLRVGDNLLAVHGLNRSLTSGDFIISVALEGVVVEITGEDELPYLEQLLLLDGLRVTELMYHDSQGDDREYIELQNIGVETLDLTGVRFTGGVEFTFPPMQLASGRYVVVVADRAAFESAYGSNIPIAGQYGGRLSNGGEDVVLQLALPWEAAILRFGYDDSWYPATDGGGSSLTIEDPAAAAVTWNASGNWHPSVPSPGGP
ncbi:MAG: lamin tail domain-containing protein, partial [Sedimentisphaerales bacterium]|nr:lamin tail domain-containing protein [Sedimentisphaerales bacterium]